MPKSTFRQLKENDKNLRPYVISVDWLSFSVHITDAFFSENKDPKQVSPTRVVQPSGYYIEKKGQGTKQWENIADCYEPDGTLIGTLTWCPRNKAQNQQSGIFKLENSVLYEGEAYERAITATIGLGLRYQSISRLDVACDFNEFYGGLLPQNFIDRAHRGDFIKVGLSRAYEHVDFTYHAYERDGKLQMLTPSMSEAEQDFYQLVQSLTIRKKKLPTLDVSRTLTRSEAIKLVADCETSDTTEAAPYVAALSLLVPNCNFVEFCREAFVVVRNKEIQKTDITPLTYVPAKPVSRKPQPRHDSLTFGRAGKSIQTIIYNKTRELREVKMKKYIVETWQRAGLDVKRDVWRVEIRIQGAGQELQNLENGTYARLSCNDLEFQSQIEAIFTAYSEKYFKWYTWDEQHQKVQNMRRTQLFCFIDPPVFRPKRIKKPVSPTRFTKVMVSALSKAKYEAERAGSKYFADVLRRARNYFVEQYEVGDYIEKIDYELHLSDGRLYRGEPFDERRERVFAGSSDGHRAAMGEYAANLEQRRATLWERMKLMYEEAVEKMRENDRQRKVDWDNLADSIAASLESYNPHAIESAYGLCIESILQPPTDLIQCPF